VRYLPIMGLCFALVFVMAGGGRRGFKASESILVVVAVFLVLAAIFAFALTRDS
jgi:hypothetical protein